MSLNDLLELDQFKATHLETDLSGVVLIHGELADSDKTCPECGKEALKPHQYYQKRVRHLPILNKPTYLVFERKDWICSCGKVFLERLRFQDLKSRYTRDYEAYIFNLCKHMTTSALAEQEQVDWDVIAGIFKKGSQGQRKSTGRSGRGRIPTSSLG